MSMQDSSKLYKTGEIAPNTARYQFVKYTDGTTLPVPSPQERIIPLNRGDRFPPINTTDKAAYWKLAV